MRPTSILAFALVALVGTPVGAWTEPPTNPGNPMAHVASLENARRTAMVAADVKALAELMAGDATYVHSNGLIQSRDDLFTMLSRGEIRYMSFEVDTVEYRSYGEVVVGTGVQTIELTSAGKPFTSRSRFTVVYAPVAGAVRLVAYQATTVPEIVPQQKN